MTRLLLLLALLGCGTETKYVSGGLELSNCDGYYCIGVELDGQEIRCIYDSGARGNLWLSATAATNLGLSELWCQDTHNTYGGGEVEVCLQSAVTACWQQEEKETCETIYPYSVEMIHDCLFGLGL